MLQRCTRYRGIPTNRQIEGRLHDALRKGGAFHFEQDELRAPIAPSRPDTGGSLYQVRRVAYHRDTGDKPGVIRVSDSADTNLWSTLDAEGRVVRERIATLGSEVVWTSRRLRS